MSYSYSQVDKGNLKWFENDNSCATLRTIKLRSGHLRSLFPCEIGFRYPISAIAGENGSGKSTVLAMAACAFHHLPKGYRPAGRKYSYYTFGDFFVQASGEIPPSGIEIWYEFLLDNWKKSKPGPGWQKRAKTAGGRWTNYDGRVKRNVIYLGINRVVPHYERSAPRAYRKSFSPQTMDQQTVDRIRSIAGKIVGKTYYSYALHSHSKYRLPVVECSGVCYSGFNMGAGESAVFDILVSLFEAGRGALLVIDEIELGLHEKAQRRLIRELKVLCKEMHCQIICSTHSSAILQELPPEARFYLEQNGRRTEVTCGISSAYACGKLSGKTSGELDLFVEDDVGGSIVEGVLPLDQRQRCTIIPIGSAEAVLRQIAARYREHSRNCIAFLDGDKKSEHGTFRGKIKDYLEGRFGCTDDEMTAWIDAHLSYLPGDTWPEKWLIEQAIGTNDLQDLAETWGTDDYSVRKCLEEALRAGKHNELYSLNQQFHLAVEQLRTDLIRFCMESCRQDLEPISECVQRCLDHLE